MDMKKNYPVLWGILRFLKEPGQGEPLAEAQRTQVALSPPFTSVISFSSQHPSMLLSVFWK